MVHLDGQQVPPEGALLEKAVARLDAGQSLPEGFPEWAPRFFQQFADQCHHAKEEDVFFPVLKQRGIPEQGGPIGVMLHEHDLGRDCVGRMREASQAQPFDARTFAGCPGGGPGLPRAAASDPTRGGPAVPASVGSGPDDFDPILQALYLVEQTSHDFLGELLEIVACRTDGQALKMATCATGS
jgi:hypothetical protein